MCNVQLNKIGLLFISGIFLNKIIHSSTPNMTDLIDSCDFVLFFFFLNTPPPL